MISIMTLLLMASSIVIPQFAQGVIGYTATQAGLILSPGGLVIIMMIPLTTRIMGMIETRYLIMVGFFIIGLSMLYSSRLVPQVSFMNLALMRGFQTLGLAFLFVPISTIAFSSLPRSAAGDATALYAMFRNVWGSVGISLSTAYIVQRQAYRQSNLAPNLSDSNTVYRDMLARYTASLHGLGHSVAQAKAMAIGEIYQQLGLQASVLAYGDVYRVAAGIAFLTVPFTLFYSRGKISRKGAPAAH